MAVFSSDKSRKAIKRFFICAAAAITFCVGEQIRHVFNRAERAIDPTATQDIVTYWDSSMISASSILRTGNVPVYATFGPRNLLYGNLHIDFTRDDAYTRGLHHIEQKVSAMIDGDARLQSLLAKPVWSQRDSRAWDAALSNMIVEANDIPTLRDFRTDDKEGVERTRLINDIAADIESGQRLKENDCEGMTLLRLVLMERLSQKHVPENNRASYYYVQGNAVFGFATQMAQRHAYVLSVRNGIVMGVVEATDQVRDSYYEAAAPCRVDEFVNGVPVVCVDGAVYGMEVTPVNARAALSDVRSKMRHIGTLAMN